jgi:hypothetical protein
MVLGKHISFSLHTGALKSVLIKCEGPLKKASFLIVGVNGIPKMPNIPPNFYCTFLSKSFTHPFLVILACPLPILGRDILHILGTTIFILSINPCQPIQFILLV